MLDVINQLQNNGFKVVGRYIHKRSSSSGRWKPVGVLNENNFFFFSDNVYPYKYGTNFIDDSTLINPADLKKYNTYVKERKEKEENKFQVTFETYFNATSHNSVFNTFLKTKIEGYLSKEFKNYYDLRGILKGYMSEAVAFPFINYEGQFQTAQLIKYASNGKRIKDAFSTNWLHTYKPVKEALNLDLDTKYQKKLTCFFGENYLNGSNNPVAIVEAPKTAVILKEFYPNIDWIATAGEQALFNKDLSVLKDKEVIFFPDAHTTLWKEFSEKEGYCCSNILEEYNAEKGSDLADYVFNSESDLFQPLHELLFCINAGDYDFEYKEDKLELFFKKEILTDAKGREKNINYFQAVPYNLGRENILLYSDDSKEYEEIFTGNYFSFYSDKYEFLNAQIDWHKKENKTQYGLETMNKTSFVFHLQKCYRTLKYLNPDKDYKEVFKRTLIKLNEESIFSFNIKYVLRRLVPLWDSLNIPIDHFKKNRYWKYIGKERLTRFQFIKELNNDRFRKKLLIRAKALQDAIEEERYIFLKSDLALSNDYRKRGLAKIGDLAKKWNKEVIGCTTEKQYFNKLKIDSFLDSCAKHSPLHIKKPYRGDSKMHKSMFSQNKIHERTGVSRRNIKQFLSFKVDADTRTLIINEVKDLINRIKEVVPVRSSINGKKRIETYVLEERLTAYQQIEKHKQVPKDVFLTIEQLRLEKKKKDISKAYKDAVEYEIEILKTIRKNNKKVKYLEEERDHDLLPDFMYNTDMRVVV